MKKSVVGIENPKAGVVLVEDNGREIGAPPSCETDQDADFLSYCQEIDRLEAEQRLRKSAQPHNP